MIAYLSGFRPSHFYKVGKEVGIKHYLYSFYDFEKGSLADRHEKDYRLFVDSGGYTARVKGVKIDIFKYIDFLNANAPYVTIAANLDTNDVEETLANQKLLLDRTSGVKILPIYHYSDYVNPKYRGLLDEYIKNFDYIGVGGVAGTMNERKTLIKFMDYVFSKTKDKIKVHGFGITAETYVDRYPFYSVDSTSWQQGMRYGGTKTPEGKPLHYRNKEHIIQNDLPHHLVMSGYLERLPYDLQYWVNFEKKYTRLWEARGVKWD